MSTDIVHIMLMFTSNSSIILVRGAVVTVMIPAALS